MVTLPEWRFCYKSLHGINAFALFVVELISQENELSYDETILKIFAR